MPSSTGEIYKFFNAELKEIHGAISEVNKRLTVLETRGESYKINNETITILNTKLDTLNSRITNDTIIKNKPNWVQVGKIIGLIITGIMAIVGSFYAGAS